MDPRDPDFMDALAAIQPAAVILDAEDLALKDTCPLSSLLVSVPRAKVIRLSPRREEIQVITSRESQAGNIQDLIDVIAHSE